jgi:hypothetical protein
MGPDGTVSWHTAEELGRHGWYRIEYPDVESCIQAQHRFTENTRYQNLRRASCEPIEE